MRVEVAGTYGAKQTYNDANMRVHTFWTIFLKILGIWLLLDCITVIPEFLVVLITVSENPHASVADIALAASASVLTLGLYILLGQLCLFKSAWLIGRLHLRKGFDEESIDLNFHRTSLLTVATIVVGGLLMINSISLLCKEKFLFYQQSMALSENPRSDWMLFHGATGILGHVRITNSRRIVGVIVAKAQEPMDTAG